MTWNLPEDPFAPHEAPAPALMGQDDPEAYVPDPELLRAASVAIRLGMPLLLTGDPGCGKTSFADHLAWRFDKTRKRALRVYARSNMEMQDMFYAYDDVGRFRSDKTDEPADFLVLNGLGEAILRASDVAKYKDVRQAMLRDRPLEVSREVVLVDEIDKAPRDVPNDLLSLLTGERVAFPARELSARYPSSREIVADAAHQPIVVCTSNSERVLPDAFLRRCIYFHIDMPSMQRLLEIVDQRIYGGKLGRESPLVASAEDLLFRVRRAVPAPEKKPGLAELLNFLKLLNVNEVADFSRPLSGDGWRKYAELTLLKTERDRADADRLLALPEP